LTHLEAIFGIDEIREIDETRNRRPGSEESYTFHGRDIYAFTGARLASGATCFEAVGPSAGGAALVRLPATPPAREGGRVRGIIDTHAVRYGSLWTSIPRTLCRELGIAHGDRVTVRIPHHGSGVHAAQLTYAHS